MMFIAINLQLLLKKNKRVINAQKTDNGHGACEKYIC